MESHRPNAVLPYVWAVAIVTVCSLLGWGSFALGLSDTNIVMIYLAGVVLASARLGRGPAIATAVLGVLSFNFFFVDPKFAFAPSDTQYFITLGGMLGVALIISELTARLQSQLAAAQEHERRTDQLFRASRQQERRTAQLYEMTRQLSTLAGSAALVGAAGKAVGEIFAGEVVIYLRESNGNFSLHFGRDNSLGTQTDPANIARFAGDGQARIVAAAASSNSFTERFATMIGSQRTIGVLGVRPADAERFRDIEERRMLETCASLIALSIEREQSILEAQQTQVQVQSEQFRNSLLSSVSHDLRTPLAMIAATADSLLEDHAEPTRTSRREMLQTIVDESRRLSRQVENLLGMARLNSGTVVLNRDWEVLEELVGVALSRLKRELLDRPISVRISPGASLIWVAGDLIEQVLVNLLENAIRYTPSAGEIEISADRVDDRLELKVADHGPGLPPDTESKVFEKFFRSGRIVADGQRGIGMGLSICKGIIEAHGGQIRAANRPSGGAEFVISLPFPAQPPPITLEESAPLPNA